MNQPPPDPAAMRRSYELATLEESTLAPTWLAQLEEWFAQAFRDFGAVEANAIQLATVDDDGLPSVRTVLAKGIDERGVSFFTNYESDKAADLDARRYAAIVFVWPAHERQVRLSGPVARVSPNETAAYFASRPRGSQLGAWASPQSRVISSRTELERALAEVTARFDGVEVPPPPHWGGYLLSPEVVEFWQGRPDRLHDRLRFRLVDGSSPDDRWVVERLAP